MRRAVRAPGRVARPGCRATARPTCSGPPRPRRRACHPRRRGRLVLVAALGGRESGRSAATPRKRGGTPARAGNSRVLPNRRSDAAGGSASRGGRRRSGHQADRDQERPCKPTLPGTRTCPGRRLPIAVRSDVVEIGDRTDGGRARELPAHAAQRDRLRHPQAPGSARVAGPPAPGSGRPGRHGPRVPRATPVTWRRRAATDLGTSTCTPRSGRSDRVALSGSTCERRSGRRRAGAPAPRARARYAARRGARRCAARHRAHA
jgi:hypothetical protein